MPPFDYGQSNQRLNDLFALYSRARKNLIVGEGLIGEVVLPCINEIRNGWDDLWQVLSGSVEPESETANEFLLDAERHFKRATSEVFEAVLIVRLDELCSILQSLLTDREYRIVKSRYYEALQTAFDRGRVALSNAKDSKHQTPDAAIKEAKTGIAVVQATIGAFMEKVGEFDLADEVSRIRHGQEVDRVSHRKSVVYQTIVAVILLLAGLAIGRMFDGWWPRQTAHPIPVIPSGDLSPTPVHSVEGVGFKSPNLP